MYNNSIVKLKPYFFLLPAFFFLVIFTCFPILNAFKTSLFKLNLDFPRGEFAWFENYKILFRSSTFRQVIKNSFVYSLSTIAIGFSLSLFLAIQLDGIKKHKNFFKVAFFYPTMIPMAAAALVWMMIFTPMYGLMDNYLSKLGFASHNWLNDPDLALGCLVTVGVWKRLGYYVIFFLAGLQNIPKSLNEAATIDGVNPVQRFFTVTLPMLSSYSFFVFITSIIDSLQAVDQVYIMTQGGPYESTNLLVYYIYENGFKYWNRGLGSAMTSVLTISLLIMTLVIFKTIGKKVYYESE